jgi:ElaB/YqjD/DUF883 family membrane-anchored ribosome-binding protein
MKKHRIENIRKVSGASSRETTPEQIKQSREMFVNLLTPVIEKMLKSPGDIKPVAESFEELARQAKSGIVRQSTQIISGENSVVQPTKNIMSESEKKCFVQPTKFNDDELRILESLKDGE